MKKASAVTAGIVGIILYVNYSCNNNTNKADDPVAEGEKLAHVHCISCHAGHGPFMFGYTKTIHPEYLRRSILTSVVHRTENKRILLPLIFIFPAGRQCRNLVIARFSCAPPVFILCAVQKLIDRKTFKLPVCDRGLRIPTTPLNIRIISRPHQDCFIAGNRNFIFIFRQC